VRTLLEGRVIAFFWAPDGKTIAALSAPEPGDDNVAGVGHATLIASGSTQAAPTGVKMRLAFVNVETGAIRSHWTFAISDVFVDQLLPYFDQYALSHRVWSPDSASIAIPVVAVGTEQVMVVPADGSGARRVADGVEAFWSP
jgi:TolB protein